MEIINGRGNEFLDGLDLAGNLMNPATIIKADIWFRGTRRGGAGNGDVGIMTQGRIDRSVKNGISAETKMGENFVGIFRFQKKRFGFCPPFCRDEVAV